MSETAAVPAAEKKARKAKPEAKPAEKPPVSKPRMRALRALAKAGEKGLGKAQLSDKASIPLTWVNEHVLKAGKATEGTQALCELGLAKAVEIDLDGVKERRFFATAKGTKLVEKFPV